MLAVGKGFQERISTTIMGSLALLFSAIGLSAAVALIVFFKRRKARKAVVNRAAADASQAIEPE